MNKILLNCIKWYTIKNYLVLFMINIKIEKFNWLHIKCYIWINNKTKNKIKNKYKFKKKINNKFKNKNNKKNIKIEL